jgi:hypothetical protein
VAKARPGKPDIVGLTTNGVGYVGTANKSTRSRDLRLVFGARRSRHPRKSRSHKGKGLGIRRSMRSWVVAEAPAFVKVWKGIYTG